MTTVIAVASNKGGVGKTTTALSMGGSLAELGEFTLLIDLDPQAHISISLGIRPEEARYTVADVLTTQQSLVSASQETKVPGLDVVSASKELTILDKVLYKRHRYEYRLREAIEHQHQQLYDFILMDCPPTFGTMTLNALTAADLLIIPIQCEYYAVRSFRQTLEMVSLIRQKTNRTLSYRLLVTMYDMRNRIHPMLLEQMQKRFSKALFKTIVQIDTRLRESPAFGLPVTHHATHTRAAEQYRALTKEMIEMVRHSDTSASQSRQPRTHEDRQVRELSGTAI
jgi:chromosome partitioning protein